MDGSALNLLPAKVGVSGVQIRAASGSSGGCISGDGGSGELLLGEVTSSAHSSIEWKVLEWTGELTCTSSSFDVLANMSEPNDSTNGVGRPSGVSPLFVGPITLLP